MLKLEFMWKMIVMHHPFSILPYLTTIWHFGAKTSFSCIMWCRSSINNILDELFWICTMNFSFKVWIYEFMNLSISGSYCEFQLKYFYVPWDIIDKRHKPHLLNPWHPPPQILPPATPLPGIELGKARIHIRIITHI